MGHSRFRQRYQSLAPTVTTGTLLTHKRTKVGGVFTPWTLFSTEDVVVTLNGREYKREMCWDSVHEGPPYRIGDHLNLIKGVNESFYTVAQDVYERPLVTTNDYTKYTYVGGFIPNRYASLSAIQPAITEAQLSALNLPHLTTDSIGATGFERFNPLRPTVNLGQTLAEFKEIPKMLVGSAKYYATKWRDAGGWRHKMAPTPLANEWLNVNFGWRPFINDLVKFYRSLKTLSHRMGSIRANNGRWVKRGGLLLDTGTKTTILESNINTGLSPNRINSTFSTTNHYLRQDLILNKKIWFTARYRYALGDPGRFLWGSDLVMRLLGLRLTPSLVYELTPWSWMIDWVSKLGDNIARAESNLDYATRFAYVMGKSEAIVRNTTSMTLANMPISHTYDNLLTRKERNRAHPLGFGLSDANLSTRQKSILVALGLSKSKRWDYGGR